MYTICVRGQFQWGKFGDFLVAAKRRKNREKGDKVVWHVVAERRHGGAGVWLSFGFGHAQAGGEACHSLYNFGPMTSADGFAATTTGDRMELIIPA
jgi:hypothetical protein